MIKKLLPVLAVLAAALIVVSTGAFTSITAERTAEIYVAGDASALLALAPAAGPNGDYADYDDDGALYLNFEDVAAAGINVDAITEFDNVFTITNNGTQPVFVELEWHGDNEDALIFDFSLSTAVVAMNQGFSLAVGQTASISFWIDSYNLSQGDEIIDSVTITATASE
jgi:hypothetical protein